LQEGKRRRFLRHQKRERCFSIRIKSHRDKNHRGGGKGKGKPGIPLRVIEKKYRLMRSSEGRARGKNRRSKGKEGEATPTLGKKKEKDSGHYVSREPAEKGREIDALRSSGS